MKVEMYTKGYCKYCVLAKSFLDSKGVSSITEYAVDVDQGKLKEMQERVEGARTVPQIFINGEYVGGYTELVELDKLGKLESLLNKTI